MALSSFQGRSSSASSFHASFLQAIDGMMSLALCVSSSSTLQIFSGRRTRDGSSFNSCLYRLRCTALFKITYSRSPYLCQEVIVIPSERRDGQTSAVTEQIDTGPLRCDRSKQAGSCTVSYREGDPSNRIVCVISVIIGDESQCPTTLNNAVHPAL